MTMTRPTGTMQNLRPQAKVMAGGLAGALSIILVYVLNQFVMSEGNELPVEVASAITTVLTFGVAYMVPQR